MRGNKYNFAYDDLYRMYVVEGKTSTEISEVYNCYPAAVIQYLAKVNIPRRRGGNTKGKPLPDRFKISREELVELYENKRLSSTAIAEMFGCQNTSILYKLRKYGIRIRHCNETKKGVTNGRKIPIDVDSIKWMYVIENKSMAEIAKNIGIGAAVVKSRLEEHGVPIKPLSQVLIGKRTGDSNPNWKPSLTKRERELRRDSSKHAKWREKVYAKDNYSCQCCGDATGSNLNAHHIESHNSNKGLRWKPVNGITLCIDCHKAFHREFGKGNNTMAQFSEFMGHRIAA